MNNNFETLNQGEVKNFVPDKVSVIIVNWNVKPLLERCLDSIFDYFQKIDYEVIVVDNCSLDNSVKYLKWLEQEKQQPKLKIILNKKNMGFAVANNQALEQATGEFILFLNPDTEFIKPGLEKLIKDLKEHNDWGIVGCRLIGTNGISQSSVRRFPNLFTQSLILLKLHYLFFWLPAIRKYFQKGFNFEKSQEVDQVAGTFILTRRALLDKIGSFDNDYHLWFEDVDLCYRFKKSGYKVIYHSDFEIMHYGGQSFDQLLSLKKQKIYNRSLIKYFEKNKPGKKNDILKIISLLSLILAGLSALVSLRKKKQIKKSLKIG